MCYYNLNYNNRNYINGNRYVYCKRRRIGKTEILRKFCEDKAHVIYRERYTCRKESTLWESDRYFDDVCIEYLRRQNREEKLPFHFTQIGRWWTKTDELDVMALDHTKKNYLLGECKYKNSKFALSDFTHMKEKFKPKGKELNLFYYLFSKNGFTEDVIAQSEKEKIKLITPMNLVQ